MSAFNFLRLKPWSPRRTGRWYASCYLLHTWLPARREWSWSSSWNRTPFRDSSRALASKSPFDNLFVLDECLSFIFTLGKLSAEIGNEIPVTVLLISLVLEYKYKTFATAPVHAELNERLLTLGVKVIPVLVFFFCCCFTFYELTYLVSRLSLWKSAFA